MNVNERIREEARAFLRTTDGLEVSNTGFEVHQTSVINVLVVGRSQAGKTTLVESFKDNTYSQELRGFSDTREGKEHPIVIRDNRNNRYYHINMIDTVGLDEHSHDSKQTRSNDEILKLSAKFIEKSITTLNAVIFVSKVGQLHMTELPALRSLMNFLGPAFQTKSMLVLTHCEGYTDDRFKDLAMTIRTHPDSRDIAEYCSLGIHPHGTLNIDNLATMASDQDRDLRLGTMRKDLRKIIPMRKKILELIIAQANNGQPVGELQEIMKLGNEARKRAIEEELRRRQTKLRCLPS